MSTASINKVIDEILDEITNFKTTIKEEITNLGEISALYMKDYIKHHVKRKGSTGNLANAIKTVSLDAENFSMQIEIDSNKAPYWEIINYGGAVFMGGLNTHFVPGRFYNKTFAYGRGQSNSNNGYRLPSGLHSKVRIKPMNYIQATQNWLSKRIDLAVSKIVST